jgi:hypothetical protein
MLTLRRCRELLPGGMAMADAEVEHRREQLHVFAEVVVDMLRRDRPELARSRPDGGYLETARDHIALRHGTDRRVGHRHVDGEHPRRLRAVR